MGVPVAFDESEVGSDEIEQPRVGWKDEFESLEGGLHLTRFCEALAGFKEN